MKLSFDDIKNIETLRLSIPTSAAGSELAEEFNLMLDRLQDSQDEFCDCPDIDLESVDLKDLEKLGKDRRGKKFELVKSILHALSDRLNVAVTLKAAFDASVIAARERLEAVHAEFTGRLRESGLSGPFLTMAVNNVPAVKDAQAELDVAKNNRVLLTPLYGNLQEGDVARIHSGIIQRFSAWVASIAEIESAPQNPEGPREQPVWTRREVMTSPNANA